jgi:hypothetical protein
MSEDQYTSHIFLANSQWISGFANKVGWSNSDQSSSYLFNSFARRGRTGLFD